MKHIQIRQGSFETNSSSSHAFTLCFPSGGQPDSRPIIRGPISVGTCAGTDDGWQTKVEMLAAYLYISDRKDEIPRLEKIISDFAGGDIPLKFDFTNWEKVILKYGEMGIGEYFETYTDGNSEYGNSEEEIISNFDNILKDDNLLLVFINNPVIQEDTYYDY